MSRFLLKNALPKTASSSMFRGPIHRQLALFSLSSVANQTHYETLGLLPTASRIEVKANYFKLSKQYHPDVNPEDDAKDKFHKISEAYAILSSDRARRAYDRKLGESSVTSSRASSPYAYSTGFGATGRSAAEAGRHAYEMHGGRKRGATYAWERVNTGARASTSHAHTHQRPSAHGHTHKHTSSNFGTSSTTTSSSSSGAHYDPSANARASSSSSSSSHMHSHTLGQQFVWPGQATGRHLREEEKRRAQERLDKESSLVRLIRGLLIVLVITWFGGFGLR